jgi:hypothetical protein
MGRAFLQLQENHVPNRLLLPLQTGVPEAQFFYAQRREDFRAFDIVSLLVRMSVLPAIQFNGKPRLHAVKIKAVSTHGMLPTEFESTESPIPQPPPNELFGPTGPLAQRTRAGNVEHETFLA